MIRSFPPVQEQMDEILRDTVEIIPEDDLVAKLERSYETGKPLRIKQGFDPTRPDLHIGHAVSIRKLHAFQELGHEVIFVVGDYTARVGDPTGRTETRPRLSPKEIDANAKTYAEQAGRILDVSRVRIEHNSQWLAPLDLAEILELTATYTVARMLERDDFAKRYAERRPISVLEFMYPLLQAYDSVALDADVELGGTDQKFNLLVGRTVQERYGQEPQVCLIMPLLRGTDGELKMSKSYDNYIGITESPEDQYGKTMSIPDELLEEWTRLATPLTGDALEAALEKLDTDPYHAKRDLARRVVETYYDTKAAANAEEHFDRVFRARKTPKEIPTVEVSLSNPQARYSPEDGLPVDGLLITAGLANSRSEAMRLIEQGGVRIDGERITDRNARLPTEPGASLVVQRGRRRFVKAVVTE